MYSFISCDFDPFILRDNLFTLFNTHSTTISDVGKITSSQNHFGNTLQSQFNTKNNTRVIAQKGGLAILPCVVKVNSPATVRYMFFLKFIHRF